MIPGTTPTLRLRIKDDTIDLAEAASVYVTLSQGMVSITKTGRELSVDGNHINVWLSQKDSLRLRIGKAEIQVNWTYPENIGGTAKRNATKVRQIDITKQLLSRVVT